MLATRVDRSRENERHRVKAIAGKKARQVERAANRTATQGNGLVGQTLRIAAYVSGRFELLRRRNEITRISAVCPYAQEAAWVASRCGLSRRRDNPQRLATQAASWAYGQTALIRVISLRRRNNSNRPET